MKKTWIALTLAGALCVPLAGCAGDKTGTNLMPDTSPTAQTTVSPTPGNGIDAANGGNNDGGTMVGDENAAANNRSAINATGRSATNGTASNGTRVTTGAGRANSSALERVGEGVKDTLDDMGNAARGMAQDAKRAMG